mmetsp:Transcript_26813/g.60613  ORF Transcript_26813/g.60613 Transcript_26813/m.60613 type:complete len:333 (-) Transcript_26813:323-1321(-)
MADEPAREVKRIDLQAKIVFFMALWYACSGATLFGNKHILSTLHCDPNILATSQMVTTAVFGSFKMYGPLCLGGKAQPTPLTSQPLRNFLFDMLVVGIMRFATVMAGLVSLKFVAVSFTETVKSSAPFFTVIFARMLLKEHTSWQVNLALVPVVCGLALCSATELSFTAIGFFAAVFNNCIDCVQNVFSKKLLSTHYNYVNLQFYTSAAALVVQLPLLLHRPDWLRTESETSTGITTELMGYLLLNGAFFHMQSVAAYGVMGLISPVSQSVANTLKRALLIWLSILYFGNPISWMSGLGTLVVLGGVFAYNHARTHYPYRPPPPKRADSCGV